MCICSLLKTSDGTVLNCNILLCHTCQCTCTDICTAFYQCSLLTMECPHVPFLQVYVESIDSINYCDSMNMNNVHCTHACTSSLHTSDPSWKYSTILYCLPYHNVLFQSICLRVDVIYWIMYMYMHVVHVHAHMTCCCVHVVAPLGVVNNQMFTVSPTACLSGQYSAGQLSRRI